MNNGTDDNPGRNTKEEMDLLLRYMSAREELSFYKTLVSGLDAIVLVMDINQMTIRWANDNFPKYLGYDMVFGRPLDENRVLSLYHPEDRGYIINLREELSRNPQGTYTSFYRFRHAEGHFLWLFSSNKVFRIDPEEDVFEVLSVSVDFTGPLSYQKNIKRFAQDKLQAVNCRDIQKITPREQQVLQLFANGYNTREVAERLQISFHTVNNHRKNMLKKLQMKNLSSLVNFAVENGLD
ncbi:MAG: LuxR C-terminal-related transcriptional regulator [Bacteroidales bacterium]